MHCTARVVGRNAAIGFIDCTLYVDPATSQPYLVWKVDGNAGGEHTPIVAQQLTADGLAVDTSAERFELIRNDLEWENICTEGPWIVSQDSYLYLFYSGNMYNTGRGPRQYLPGRA